MMNQIMDFINRSHTSIKFAFVGSIGFVVDLTMMLLLLDVFQVELMLSRVIAFTIAASSNWFLNRKLTFIHKNLTGYKSTEWLRFLISAIISAIPNLGIFYSLIQILPQTHLMIIFAMCSGILAGYFTNYYLASRWVYKS